MPEGQFTGTKATYIYVSDNGTEFAMYRDIDLVLGTLTGLTLYDETASFAFPLPRGFKPRGVHWLGFIGQRMVRKFLICGNLNAPLYVSDSSTAVTIDGVVGFITGKKGEAIRLVRRSRTIVDP